MDRRVEHVIRHMGHDSRGLAEGIAESFWEQGKVWNWYYSEVGRSQGIVPMVFFKTVPMVSPMTQGELPLPQRRQFSFATTTLCGELARPACSGEEKDRKHSTTTTTMKLLDTLRQLVATKKRTPKELAIKVQKVYEELHRREIRDWQEARNQWNDPTYPHTYPLQLVYKDALIDLHTALQNRTMRIAKVPNVSPTLINGQTMTMDDVASLSQSHCARTSRKSHHQGRPTNGYLGGATVHSPALPPPLRAIPEWHRIAVEEVTLPSERIKIAQVLLQSGVRLSKEYLENTYGVEESTPELITDKKTQRHRIVSSEEDSKRASYKKRHA